jgi:glucose/arabinose dehydrogenase
MKKLLLALLLLAGSNSLRAQTLQLDSTTITLSVEVDSTKLIVPWDIAWGFDNRLWITDTRFIKAWNPTTQTMTELLRIPHGYYCGLAVPKTNTQPIYVYAVLDTGAYYAGSSLAHLLRYTYNIGSDTLTNPDTLVSYRHLSEHSGGRVMIGVDGKIWLTTPEFTFTDDTIGAVVGRTLRLNPDGTYPSGNLRPDFTYSIGHRNAQGICQLPDGTVFESEHSAPTTHDEVNRITLGGQYGWPAADGNFFCFMNPDSCASPTFAASHKNPAYMGPMTPAGLDYYDHPAIPEWQNCLIVGTLWVPDSCLAILKLSNDHDSVLNRRNYLKKHAGGINDFKRTRDVCVAPDGSIYFIVHDRQFAQPVDTLINVSTKIIRMRNDAYIPPQTVASAEKSRTKIYPNPAKDELVIENSKGSEFTISDIGGREIMSGRIRSRREKIDISKLPPATYLLNITGEASLRFIKE